MQAPRQITISIPRDHLKLPEILKLAQELATYTEHPDGLAIQRQPLPDAEERVLGALQRLFDIDVEAIKQRVLEQPRSTKDPIATSLNELGVDPSVLGVVAPIVQAVAPGAFDRLREATATEP